MKQFDRYLARYVLLMSGLVALVLIALFSFVSFVGDVDETGQGRYGLGTLAIYTLLMMPSALYTLLPVIALLGTMAGLGILASQGELTALRAAGVSGLRLAGSAMVAGGALALLTLALGDWMAPKSAEQAERLRTAARSGVDAGAITRPVWLRAGDDVLQVRRLEDSERLAMVDLFRLDRAGGLVEWSRVESMRFEEGLWRLRGVDVSRFAGDRIDVERGVERVWDGELSPDVLRLLMLEADSASILGLNRLVRYLKANELDFAKAERSLWRKLMAPFTVLAMTVFAVPFVFGSMRDSGMGQRLFIGVLVGVTFFVLNEVTGSLGQLYHWPPLVGAGAPSAALVAVGLWRLRRLH